ncbi:MAG TPA: N-acetylglucosamine-6-phosphate deacetylase, partial [Anaerolineae bacterium]|nr:N-acetylglucosamine-6-phosphate deacetylase [Anaerolineae bacterium]
MLVIKNATIFTPEPLDHPFDLFIEAERITRMAPHGQVEPPANARLIDASGLQLVPGFIDLQLNGAFGHDFTAKPETIWPVSAELPRFGVTSYLPTIITSPLETVAAAQDVLLRQRPEDFSGA